MSSGKLPPATLESDQARTPSDQVPKGTARFENFRFFTLWAIAIVCIILAIFGKKLDQQSATLLGIAVVAIVIDQVTRFEFGGFKIEKRIREAVQSETADLRDEIHSNVKDFDKAVTAITKQISLPGSPAEPSARLSAAETGATVDRGGEWNSDPNYATYGDKREQNGRELSVRIRSAAGPRSAKCRVSFTVKSIDPASPLTGSVIVHLHPTYGKWAQYPLDVVKGKAADDFDAWGVFTIGIDADGGKTKLGCYLGNVPGGTQRFYSQ